MSKFVIRGGYVLSLDTATGVLPIGDVLVEDAHIIEIGPALDTGPDVEVVDASNCIVMPGFVDTHRHLWQTSFRGDLASCSLGDYFTKVMIGLAPSMTPEEIHAGTLLGSYQLLDAGITTVIDWANVINTPAHADAGIQALSETGIRAMYAYGWPGGPEHLFHSTIGHPEDVRRVATQYFASKDQLLTLGVGLRGPVSNPAEVLVSDWALARDVDARINVHTGMRIPGIDTQDITILDDLGLLGPDSTYVHCTGTTETEFGRIAATGGHVSVAAYGEMVMGHGRPPTERLLKAGLRPSLSADIVATSPGDMFSLMRATYADARISAYPEDRNEPFEPTVTAEDALAWATVNGAAALGLSDRIGTLAPGKEADILLVRVDRVNAMPNIDPISTIVTQVDTSNIDTVFVRGRAVKRHGQLLNADIDSLRELADRVGRVVHDRMAAMGGAAHH